MNQSQKGKVVDKGQIETLRFPLQIPTGITQSTSVGEISAKYFQLEVNCSQGCCNYSEPTAKAHLLIHAKQPVLAENKKVDPPTNWNPVVAPLIACSAMKPYQYHANNSISVLNLHAGGEGSQGQGTKPNYNINMHGVQGQNPEYPMQDFSNPKYHQQPMQMENPTQVQMRTYETEVNENFNHY